jgi:tetratricopeptide (TPR) repeat protein
VTRKPSAETESGRQRLRGISGQWYRSFLQDELRTEQLVTEEGMRVRMHIGRMLVEQGDLESALPFFSEVYDNRPSQHVPSALLRLAQTNVEIASSMRDASKSRDRFEQAEKWCRKLLELHPASPESTGATVTLGKALLGQAATATDEQKRRELCDRCRTELAARVMRLQDTLEMLDVWLVVGEAQEAPHLAPPQLGAAAPSMSSAGGKRNGSAAVAGGPGAAALPSSAAGSHGSAAFSGVVRAIAMIRAQKQDKLGFPATMKELKNDRDMLL